MGKKTTAPARLASTSLGGAAERERSIKQISKGARIADALLMLGFAAAATYTGWWGWWACAAFSAVTVVMAPLEKFMNLLSSKLIRPARR